MKLWIDDIRNPPNNDYVWIKSVNEFVKWFNEQQNCNISIIDLDHDSGDYCKDGGDYIRILDFLEFMKMQDKELHFKIHSMNPVGRHNMKNIILKHKNWTLER